MIASHRKAIHEYPELGGEEYKTNQRVARFLRSQKIKILDSNIKARDFDDDGKKIKKGTGIIARVKGAPNGPTIAVRVDMDALPIEESLELKIRSSVKGVAHLCGHDYHTAAGMWAAWIFQKLAKAKKLNGNILLIFQPSEEKAHHKESGAIKMVQALRRLGARENINAFVAAHVFSRYEKGSVKMAVGERKDQEVVQYASSELINLSLSLTDFGKKDLSKDYLSQRPERLGAGGHVGYSGQIPNLTLVGARAISLFEKIENKYRREFKNNSIAIDIPWMRTLGAASNKFPDSVYLPLKIFLPSKTKLNNKIILDEVQIELEKIIKNYQKNLLGQNSEKRIRLEIVETGFGAKIYLIAPLAGDTRSALRHKDKLAYDSSSLNLARVAARLIDAVRQIEKKYKNKYGQEKIILTAPLLSSSTDSLDRLPQDLEIPIALRALLADSKIPQKIVNDVKKEASKIIAEYQGKFKEGKNLKIKYSQDVPYKPVVFRDQEIIKRALKVSQNYFGKQFNHLNMPDMTAEDFSFYLELLGKLKIPGAFISIGGADPQNGIPKTPQHSPNFLVYDEALVDLTAILTLAALDFIEYFGK